MKNKTVLQELLEYIQTKGTVLTTEDLDNKIQELLPKEKEQIENAYIKGIDGHAYYNEKHFEDYYNKSYLDE